MKKIISLALALLLALSAVACSGGNADTTTADPGTNAPDPATKPESTETEAPADETTSESSTEDKMLNILFLGNSLMYYNDMPQIFADIATAAGYKVNVESVTKGSATISDFAELTTEVGRKAIPLLKEKKWDYVIIEPSRRISPYEDTVKAAEFASAKKIQELAHAAGGEVVLYSVWGNNNGSVTEYKANSPTNIVSVSNHSMGRRTHTKFMQEINAELAAALGGVKVALAGYAFENFIAKYPDVNLYHSDERHPSLDGSYLAACVIYSTLFEKSVIGNSMTAGTAPAKIQEIASETVSGLVPDLTETETEKGFNLLVVGSNLMDNYACTSVFGKLALEADGLAVDSLYVRSSTFVINNVADEKNDLGLRAALAEKEWDAILIQISRRCTRSGSDVEASELAALKAVLPLMKAETEKIFLFTLNSDKNPAIFTTASGDPGYTKTGKTESYSAVEGSAYFKELADRWAGELGIGVINYGQAYHDYANPAKAGLGYLQACMIYNSVFGRTLPDGMSETNGLSASVAESLRKIAEKYCLIG